ncbi:fumarylacetoacetate hydrolase family protein [Leifsonia sp. Root112D2]|uniref:fumarylacetoacetate hydrolase family protein n=1 Tax=Leifsonia sp. Root112D2 TaxID=1736426 RepID=UPI0006FC3565|nr:fumarylacetoacetate hydrolase family protein [Leifsonia sp. Root112D2]KQV07855.1 hydroxylase [Leifsonia sp. Root112D2]
MKIASWVHDGAEHAGVIVDDLAYALPEGTSVLDLVRGGLETALQAGRAAVGTAEPVRLAEVRLLPPLQPPAMRDFVAFEEHVEGMVKGGSPDNVVGAEWYQAPTFYFTNPHTVRATGDDIAAPADSHALDFELEVAAVIGAVEGSDGVSLTPSAAHRHIFGYMIFNDWSARDLQNREMRVSLGPCKGKDFANTLGPWIVTADEFEQLHDDEGFLPIAMSVSINGMEYGRDLLSNMGWPFAELVAYASRDSKVVPGDVLGCGTAGTGCLAEAWGRSGSQTPPPLQHGDVVRMDVEGIGFIENRVVAGVAQAPVAPARVRPRNRVRGSQH